MTLGGQGMGAEEEEKVKWRQRIPETWRLNNSVGIKMVYHRIIERWGSEEAIIIVHMGVRIFRQFPKLPLCFFSSLPQGRHNR